MTKTTTTAVTIKYFGGASYGTEAVIPAGTKCHSVKGGTGWSWAVSDPSKIHDLRQRDYDLQHYWVFVPDEAFE